MGLVDNMTYISAIRINHGHVNHLRKILLVSIWTPSAGGLIDMEIYDWETLTEFETNRQKNIIRNYEFMKACGKIA